MEQVKHFHDDRENAEENSQQERFFMYKTDMNNEKIVNVIPSDRLLNICFYAYVGTISVEKLHEL